MILITDRYESRVQRSLNWDFNISVLKYCRDTRKSSSLPNFLRSIPGSTRMWAGLAAYETCGSRSSMGHPTPHPKPARLSGWQKRVRKLRCHPSSLVTPGFHLLHCDQTLKPPSTPPAPTLCPASALRKDGKIKRIPESAVFL